MISTPGIGPAGARRADACAPSGTGRGSRAADRLPGALRRPREAELRGARRAGAPPPRRARRRAPRHRPAARRCPPRRRRRAARPRRSRRPGRRRPWPRPRRGRTARSSAASASTAPRARRASGRSRRPRRLAIGPTQLDAVGDPDARRRAARSSAASGPAPAIRARSRSSRRSGIQQHVDALLGDEPARESDGDRRRAVARIGGLTRPSRRGGTRSRSMPSGITRARPANPLRSAMRAASVLQAEMPAARRSAQRSSQRNGIG